MSSERMRGIDPLVVVGRLRARGRVGTLVSTWLDHDIDPFIPLPNQSDASTLVARLIASEYEQGTVSRDSDSTGVNSLFCRGNYFLVINDLGEKIESSTLSAALTSGVYFNTIVTGPDSTDSSNLSAALASGVYFLVIVPGPDSTDSSNLSTALTSGVYFNAVISADDKIDNTNLSVQLVSGAYIHV